jgi:hypothetical protein
MTANLSAAGNKVAIFFRMGPAMRHIHVKSGERIREAKYDMGRGGDREREKGQGV